MIQLVWVFTSQVREERGCNVPAIAVEMVFEGENGEEDEIWVIFNEWNNEEVLEVIKNGLEDISSDDPIYQDFVSIARRELKRQGETPEEEALLLEKVLGIVFV